MRYIFFMAFLYSCTPTFTESEVIGTYTANGYMNNFDTIILQPKGFYQRKVYDAEKKAVLNMKGKWRFYDDKMNAIYIESFYLNLDDDLLAFPELVNDTIGSGGFSLSRVNGSLEFCVGYFSADLSNQNCYRKILLN